MAGSTNTNLFRRRKASRDRLGFSTNVRSATILSLPVELRTKILRLTFDGERVQIRRRNSWTRTQLSKSWTVLFINRQIRDEIRTDFFRDCHFELHEKTTRKDLVKWLSCIGQEAIEHMRSVTISCRNKCEL